MEAKKIANCNREYEVCAIRPESLPKWESLDWFADEKTIVHSQNNIDKEGTARIYIQGVLEQKPIFTWQENSCYESIKTQIESCLSNGEVKKIILDINSPGGSVLGVADLAEYIFSSRAIKPIFAFVNSMAASAAYWVASACTKIILASETTVAGSIGVVAIHLDTSKQESNFGVKVTEIVAGKYKRIASSHGPLENEGKSFLQSQVDEYYNIFISSVAKYRGKSIDEILLVADGKEYIGSRAIISGLADEIQNGFVLNSVKEGRNMNELEQLKQENEKLKQEIEELKKKQKEAQPPQDKEGKDGEEEKPNCENDEEKKDEKIAKAVSQAIKAERERMASLDELPVDEKTISVVLQAKKDGWSVEKASYELVKAQKKNGMANLRADLIKEQKPVSTLGNLPSYAEMEEKNLVSMAVSSVNKRRQ